MIKKILLALLFFMFLFGLSGCGGCKGPKNHPPVVYSSHLSVSNKLGGSIVMKAVDPDGDALNFIIVTAPAHGRLCRAVLTEDGNGSILVYTPNRMYGGVDAFKFKVNDGSVDSNVAKITIDVVDTNRPPNSLDSNITTGKNMPTGVILHGTDPDNDPLTYTVTTDPTHGTLTGTAPELTYTPDANYTGSDFFSFNVNDGSLTSPLDGNITIDVISTGEILNHPPVADDLEIATNEDAFTLATLHGTDPDNDPLTYTVTTGPTHGTLAGTAPNLTYTPDADYFGLDSFKYKVDDGSTFSLSAEVNITITSVNDLPKGDDLNVTLDEDSNASVTLHATDADGDSLTYTVTTDPTHGTLTGTAPNLTYTPDANYFGTDYLEYVANDGTADSATIKILFHVTGINDAPVAHDDSKTLNEDTSIEFNLTSSDVDHDVVSYVITTDPTHGTLLVFLDDSNSSSVRVQYIPDGDFFGTDSVKFKVNDGITDSEIATVSFTVNNVNDAPTVNYNFFSFDEDSSQAFTLTGNDVDGDSLTYTVTTGPTHGTLTGTAPNLTYTPDGNFTGWDWIEFKANDGTVDSSDAACVDFEVRPVNDAPVADDGNFTLDEDVPTGFSLSAHDVDGDSLTYTVTTGPTHGTLTGTAPNLTYTPDADYNGTDVLKFQADDGTVMSDEATVNITINPVNDAPVAKELNVTLAEDGSTSVVLDGNDAENDPLTFSVTTAPSHGTLTGTAPNLTYTPDPDYFGADSFEYIANDGSLNSPPVAVSVDVTSVNDAPTASDFSLELEVWASENEVDWKDKSSALDVDGDSLTAHFTNGADSMSGAYGDFAIRNNIIHYTRTTDGNMTDSITLVVSDGVDSTNITVELRPLYWEKVVGGSISSLAIKSNGTLWSWGIINSQHSGCPQAGSQSPEQVEWDSDWKDVDSGFDHAIAIKNDGTIWAWGSDDFGQLGNDVGDETFEPQQIGTDDDWFKVYAGGHQSFAIKQDGSLWAWGENGSGQLGLGDNTNRDEPERVGVDNDWVSASGSFNHALAIKQDGSLWAWGENGSGQLGLGDNTNRDEPAAVSPGEEWATVSGGGDYTLATKTDGTIWSWGGNWAGQLGFDDYNDRDTPDNIDGDSDWGTSTPLVSVGEAHSLAIKNNGVMFAWGLNDDGQLGDDSTDSRAEVEEVDGRGI